MFCSYCGTEVFDTAKFCPACGRDLAATTPMAAVGNLDQAESDVVRNALQADYEIVEELGRGGMAIVYKAFDKHLERDVAIKVLPFSLSFDAEFVERFQREARTAAQLEHPNIIPIYRVGQSGRVIYFVMKFLRGESLSERLEERERLAPDEIRQILMQTGSALGYAHEHDIVHRDIKPDNIMFDDTGRAIVTDFGIAKAASGTRLTGTGMSIGTPHYMSPEQARAHPLDGRSDIYSLGVVAYQCLVGLVPFDGEDSFAIGYKHIMDDLPEPPLATAEQRSLYDVIKRMMAKAPDDRFQTAEALVRALEVAGPAVVRSSDVTRSSVPTTTVTEEEASPATVGSPARRPTTPTTPIPSAPHKPLLGADRAKRQRKRKRSGVLLGFVVLLLLAGGSGAGSYWYFFLDAQWPLPRPLPLPFMETAQADSLDTAADPPAQEDSSAVAVEDTVGATVDSASASEDTTAAAEPGSAELPNTGTLVIRLPAGARLKVDGRPMAQDSLDVDAGSYKIEVERTGYEKFEETVRVGRGQTMVLPVSMVRIQAPEPETTQPPPEPAEAVDCAPAVPSAAYFRSDACYDTRPSPTAPPVLDVPVDFTGQVNPVTVLVRVGLDGRAIRTLRGPRQTADPRLQIAALRYAQDSLNYLPARMNGQPVEAWARVTIQFRRR